MASLNDLSRKHITALMPIIDDLPVVNDYLFNQDIEPPKAKTKQGYKARLLCPRWWVRTLDRKQSRAVEAKEITVGHVNSKAAKYSSEYAVAKTAKRASDNKKFIDLQSMISDAGDNVEMADIVKGSLANPTNRRAELMIRMAGFEAYAMTHGQVGEFYTLTCPAKFHRYSSGTFNADYDSEETNPKVAQKYLCSVWAKIRSNFRIHDIRVYGFRVAEPHHDGCPHWHMLLFVDPAKREQLRAIMQEYALEMDGDEPGAKTYRFKAVGIDPDRGTATGYIAKYISKNLGFNIEDVTDVNTTDYGLRVKAWASIWGIRQFQQIGGVSVSVWRELRKLKNIQGDEILEAARLAADESRWSDFLEIMGGADVKRDDLTVKLKKNMMLCESTGELKQNRYGELLNIVIGLMTVATDVRTRFKTWIMIKTRESSEAVNRFSASGEDAAQRFTPSWSPVNNCA